MTELLVYFPQTDTHKTFEDNLVEYTVVHRIKGRLRLKIPSLAGNQDYASRLQWLILKTNVIKEHRINNAAASLIIFYDWQTSSEAVILDYLESIIQKASQITTKFGTLTTKDPDFGFPILAMITAILASPLELPFFIVGCTIVVASLPLWQRVSTAVSQKGKITVESLDALWLTAQLIQGNGIAGALALNLLQVGETLRQNKLKPMEKELYVSLEETESLQEVKTLAQKLILPTLLLSGLTLTLTKDLGRASAWLPLNIGVSLRGATPLAVDSALTVETSKPLSTADQESLAIATAGNLLAVGGGVIFGLDPIITVLLNGGAAILGELNSSQRLPEKY